MRKQIHIFTYFGAIYLIFFVLLLTLILSYPKGELHLMLTSVHNAFLDIFFKIITEIGGSIPVIVGLLFLFYRIGASIYILLAQLLNISLTTALKLYFGVNRPLVYFSENFPDVTLHKVDGIVLHSSNSFPSGHTSASFALMLCIALIFPKKPMTAVICCILAILTGYSRIYLSQHFAQDVLFGSIIGIISAIIMYPFYEKLNSRYTWSKKNITTLRIV